MYSYNTLYGLYSPYKKPFLLNTDIHPLFGKNKIGGRVNPDVPIPTPIMDIAQVSKSNSIAPLLGTLASVILPAVTSVIMKKFFDKNKNNDKKAIKQMEDIIEVIEDDIVENDEIDSDTRSLLNRIIGRGIMEL